MNLFFPSQYPPAITKDEPEDAPLSHDDTQETTLDETPVTAEIPEPIVTEEVIKEEAVVKPTKKSAKKVKEVPVVEAVAKTPVAVVVPVVVEAAPKLPKSPTKEETDAEVISRSGRKIKPKRLA